MSKILMSEDLSAQLSLQEERELCRQLVHAEDVLLERLAKCTDPALSTRLRGASRDERTRLIDGHRAWTAEDEDVAALWEHASTLRWRLALSALDQVRYQVRRRSHAGIADADLYQAGVLGCWEASGCFELGRGSRFGTYARPWIRSALGELAGTLGQAMRLPRSARQDMWALGRGRSAAAKGSVRRRLSSLAAVRDAVSLEQERGDGRTWADTVPCDTPSPHDQLVRRHLAAQLRRALQRTGLNERHRMILSRRYKDARRPDSHRSLGEELGVSGERVRQLKHQALRHLRRSLEAA